MNGQPMRSSPGVGIKNTHRVQYALGGKKKMKKLKMQVIKTLKIATHINVLTVTFSSTFSLAILPLNSLF